MIKSCILPATGGVAVVAAVIAINMQCRFAGGYATVVTTSADAQYLGMIDPGNWFPAIGPMAAAADDGGAWMAIVPSLCFFTVMTDRAGDTHRAMVEPST